MPSSKAWRGLRSHSRRASSAPKARLALTQNSPPAIRSRCCAISTKPACSAERNRSPRTWLARLACWRDGTSAAGRKSVVLPPGLHLEKLRTGMGFPFRTNRFQPEYAPADVPCLVRQAVDFSACCGFVLAVLDEGRYKESVRALFFDGCRTSVWRATL